MGNGKKCHTHKCRSKNKKKITKSVNINQDTLESRDIHGFDKKEKKKPASPKEEFQRRRRIRRPRPPNSVPGICNHDVCHRLFGNKSAESQRQAQSTEVTQKMEKLTVDSDEEIDHVTIEKIVQSNSDEGKIRKPLKGKDLDIYIKQKEAQIDFLRRTNNILLKCLAETEAKKKQEGNKIVPKPEEAFEQANVLPDNTNGEDQSTDDADDGKEEMQNEIKVEGEFDQADFSPDNTNIEGQSTDDGKKDKKMQNGTKVKGEFDPAKLLLDNIEGQSTDDKKDDIETENGTKIKGEFDQANLLPDNTNIGGKGINDGKQDDVDQMKDLPVGYE